LTVRRRTQRHDITFPTGRAARARVRHSAKAQDEINAEACARRNAEASTRHRKHLGAWQQSAVNCAGPLCLLDVVGQAEESWVELFEHAPRCDLDDKPKAKDDAIERRPYFGQPADTILA
jgi:hypothetical protein